MYTIQYNTLTTESQELISLFRIFKQEDKIKVLESLINVASHKRIIPFQFEAKKDIFKKQPMIAWTLEKLNKSEMKDSLDCVLLNYKINSYYQGIALVLDEWDLAVIDVDNVEKFNKNVMNIDEFLSEISHSALMIEKSIRKGYHIYIEKSYLLRQIREFPNNKKLLDKYGFEIRHKGLMICYPSTYIRNTHNFQTQIISINTDNRVETEALLRIIDLSKTDKKIEKPNIEDTVEEKKEKKEEKIETNNVKVKITEDAIRQIKERAKFSDFITPTHSYTNYQTYHCPFHPPDRSPSFTVYENQEGEYAIDLHDDRRYDIISFYQELYHCDFITATKELARKYNIELTVIEERGQNKEEEMKAIKSITEEITKEDVEEFVQKMETLKKFLEERGEYIRKTNIYKKKEVNDSIEYFIFNQNIFSTFLENVKINNTDDEATIKQKIHIYKTETFSFVMENETEKIEKTYFIKDFLSRIYEYIQIIQDEIKEIKHFETVFGIEIWQRFPFQDVGGNPDYIWYCEMNQLVCRKKIKNHEKDISIKPFFAITHRLVDEKEKVIGYRLKKVDGKIFDISHNLQDKEVEEILASYGIPIGKNEKITSYLISYWMLYQKDIPDLKVISSIGWYDGKYYVPQIEGQEIEIKNQKGYEAVGDKQKEVKLMQKLMKNHLGLGYVFSFASTLIYLLRTKNVVIYIQGSNSKGKTTMANIGLSIWGDYEKLGQSVNSTRVGKEISISTKKDRVILLDELNTASGRDKYSEVATLIYEFVQGEGKERATKHLELKEKFTYRGILVITAELDFDTLLKNANGYVNGAVRRTITIDMTSFDDIKQELFSEIYDSISKNYGNLIKDWIEFLEKKKKEEIEETFNKYIHICISSYDLKNGMDRNFALFFTAIELMGECFQIETKEMKEIIEKIIKDNTILLNKRSEYTKEEVEELIYEFIQENINKGIIYERKQNENVIDLEQKHVAELFFIQAPPPREGFYFTTIGLQELSKKGGVPEKELKRLLVKYNMCEPDKDRLIKRTTIKYKEMKIKVYYVKLNIKDIDEEQFVDLDFLDIKF